MTSAEYETANQLLASRKSVIREIHALESLAYRGLATQDQMDSYFTLSQRLEEINAQLDAIVV